LTIFLYIRLNVYCI